MLENITEITSLEKDVQISPWSEKNFKDALSADNLFKIFKYKKNLLGFMSLYLQQMNASC